jgi:hypothetical protein
MNSRICKWLVSFAVFFCLIFVVSTATAEKKVKPPPEPEPGLSQPAFAYYCKSNPNSGAVCLANEDGSSPVKIFTTSKFQGSSFNIAAFQDSTEGKVLVEDGGDLWRIDYVVDSGGFLVSVEDPQKLIDGGLWLVDWSPNGGDFALPVSGVIYLGSRIDYDSGNLGEPIVVMPPSPSEQELLHEGISALAWSADGQAIYFIKSNVAVDGFSWKELHKAEIGDYLGSTGGIQYETQCLLSMRSSTYVDESYCSKIDNNLNTLSLVSHSDDGLMVSARGIGSDLEETYYIYIFDGVENWVDIQTPGFMGHDWTSDGTIIGQTDDDEVLSFDPETGDISILIKKNATSPDWNN